MRPPSRELASDADSHRMPLEDVHVCPDIEAEADARQLELNESPALSKLQIVREFGKRSPNVDHERANRGRRLLRPNRGCKGRRRSNRQKERGDDMRAVGHEPGPIGIRRGSVRRPKPTANPASGLR